ncbi:MAG: alpha/beta hydrolase [Chloroflexota bacterium]
MDNRLRTYGDPPFTVAVIHGGPGAYGEMKPVAQQLATSWSVLEPRQSALSVSGQVEELKYILRDYSIQPTILIGFSWGAWLSFMVAAKYPNLVSKLILVGSDPFEAQYATGISATRQSRLTAAEQNEYQTLSAAFSNDAVQDKNRLLTRLGELAQKTDTYDPISTDDTAIDFRADIFQAVWPEAAQLRRNGTLLALGDQIQCPVLAIHGDYDPHPADVVQKPLSAQLADFQFVLLQHCGHKPWIERQAKAQFYAILQEALKTEST